MTTLNGVCLQTDVSASADGLRSAGHHEQPPPPSLGRYMLRYFRVHRRRRSTEKIQSLDFVENQGTINI